MTTNAFLSVGHGKTAMKIDFSSTSARARTFLLGRNEEGNSVRGKRVLIDVGTSAGRRVSVAVSVYFL